MLHDALARMPHRGDMRLIDEVVAAGPDNIHCRARPHDAADYPLRLDGLLYGASLAELGAQAAAAHASLFGMGSAHMGLVLSFSDLDVHCNLVETVVPAEVRAERLSSMDGASLYRFEVTTGGETIVCGDVLLSIRERPA